MSRRTLGGLAAVGLGLPALAACSGDGGSTTAPDQAVDPAATPSSSGSAPSPSTSAPAAPLASTDDVPVGGATILAEEGVVLSQPVAGEFTAFSALCTHQGCPVTEIVDGEVVCPCHGSAFSTTTGEPSRGPAERPLAPVAISVTGDSISLA